MEIPDLVRERLGDEEIRAGVNLGDEDVVCLTPTRTLVYRGEGLLSDESVSVLSHDVERIAVQEGRRKTTFEFEYVEGTESFSVPKSRADKVLELLIEGVLRVADVTDADESVHGVYRFSELTLILTDQRLVKHIGSSLWDEDFEEFPFADVTGLAFEEGSVATQIVITIDGRPQRIKAPNDEAPMLRQTLEQALFAYHGVDSLVALNTAVAPDEDDVTDDDGGEETGAVDLTLDDGIDPLVGGADEEVAEPEVEPEPEASQHTDSSEAAGSAAAGESRGADEGGSADAASASAASPDTRTGSDGPTAGESMTTAGNDATSTVDPAAVSREDIDDIGEQLDALTTTVKKQNQLLRKQQQTIKQLIQELRQGR